MRVLICGAGIAGLTLAWCLERRGHEPLVVERAPRIRDEGYMIDFFGSGFGIAERLGLLPDLESIHYPVDREDQPHLILRDLITRMSTWPGVAGLLRRRMVAESVLGRV